LKQELIRTRFIALWFSSLLLHVGLACFSAGASPAQGANATALVRSITLPHFEPELPTAPGRDQYLVVCVSCHSPRYVLMQPLFPQRQWEETVDKMAKVYGAQMDEAQRAAIVQYLVTTHGPESKQGTDRGPDRDEDSDFAPAAKPSSPGPALLLKLATGSAERATELQRGAELFKQDCSACHGPTGRGDGFISQVLLRKPKDLAATRFSLDLLSQVLWNGKRGTAMPSWRSLPQKDLTALAAYVQTLHQSLKPDIVSPESLQRGKQVFLQNCAPCHGVAGDGKGTAATTLIPEPANFRLKQPDFDYILEVLNNGIPGTSMPAWNQQISEPDRQALAHFLRSLFQAQSPSEH
jgi:mono/diheme cytochrome c family protein